MIYKSGLVIGAPFIGNANNGMVNEKRLGLPKGVLFLNGGLCETCESKNT